MAVVAALLRARGHLGEGELAFGRGFGVEAADHPVAARLHDGGEQQPPGRAVRQRFLQAAIEPAAARGAQGPLAAVPAEDLRVEPDHAEHRHRQAGLCDEALDQPGQAAVADQIGLDRRAEHRGARGGRIRARAGVLVEQPEPDQAGEQFGGARLGAVEPADDVHHGCLGVLVVEEFEHFDHARGDFRLVGLGLRHRPLLCRSFL